MRTALASFALLGAAVAAAGAPLGCGTSAAPAPSFLPRSEMLDPQACQSCHVNHYAQWAGSMHAYASDDPVFLAMNARGQRETGGQLGSFCVKCHAPMALAEGATRDGTNLASVPRTLHGVTCFFCHTIDAVTGAHNAAVSTSGDLVMRGEYADPVANSAHASAYDALHDRSQPASAGLCGACHDIDSPAGAHIERTYAEWLASAYSGPGGNSCAQCHMASSAEKGPIAQVPNAALPARFTYAHDFPGVDVALTPGFAGAQGELAAVQSFLQTTLQAGLCVTQPMGGGAAVRVILDNVAAGHSVPSGASQDRRVWAEVIASKGGAVFYQSGVVADGAAVTSLRGDPDLWLMRDCMFDASGKQVDMFWQAVTTDGNELPGQKTFDMSSPAFYATHVYQTYPRQADAVLAQVPDQVTLRVRVQPIGLDVLGDLVASGDLAQAVAAAMPTFDAVPLVTWTATAATLTYQENGLPVTCVSPTGLNVAADKVLATDPTKCSP